MNGEQLRAGILLAKIQAIYLFGGTTSPLRRRVGALRFASDSFFSAARFSFSSSGLIAASRSARSRLSSRF